MGSSLLSFNHFGCYPDKDPNLASSYFCMSDRRITPLTSWKCEIFRRNFHFSPRLRADRRGCATNERKKAVIFSSRLFLCAPPRRRKIGENAYTFLCAVENGGLRGDSRRSKFSAAGIFPPILAPLPCLDIFQRQA